jgi:hypothetical protein
MPLYKMCKFICAAIWCAFNLGVGVSPQRRAIPTMVSLNAQQVEETSE